MKYLILSFVVLISACSNSINEIEPVITEKNPRIIFKSLIKPNVSVEQKNDISSSCLPTEIIKKVIVKECDHVNEKKVTAENSLTIYKLLEKKPLLVGFYNEQKKHHNQNQEFETFLNSVNVNVRYIIMGHSHGLSSYGVEKLAYMRANHIKQLLIEQGVASENVITLANWSKAKLKDTPPLGVEIYY